MIFKRLATFAAAATLSSLVAGAFAGAEAVTLSPARGAIPQAVSALAVELAHGCHRGIQRDYSGWHYHTRACVRLPTAPPGLADYYQNRRFYRPPMCKYRCEFIGPVKTCQQVCR